MCPAKTISQEVTDVGTVCLHVGANQDQVIVIDIPAITTSSLGTEHMNAVGYDLYCKMLKEALKEAKGIHTMEDFETSVDLNVDAYIPDSYISNEFQCPKPWTTQAEKLKRCALQSPNRRTLSNS